ncbi:FtsK/SpoIIIE domain-containing protein [Streptomyces sp. VNUA116]|uniref:FtsK/SpoIIIE domain-containing protein n=1 Tax=Streptomyces sp. VNUA116 TaxID=3062449 RepID=UPI002676EE46|nr:FtsK/SpoIIIE domain-containing protein [Streptomyces sp. VNUA116]WKU45937.1 FtsK/SpoIIIE domain-containing protein [Streptomyces sp. VNUA116]
MSVSDVVEIAPVIAGAVLALWALKLLFGLVRYVRADRMLRAGVRQAFVIRRRWKRLARLAGLTVTDRTPTFMDSLTTKDGKTPKPRVRTPRILVTADHYGVVVRAECLPKVGLDEYQRAAPYLADAWRCTRVSVLPNGPGQVLIRGVRVDPLSAPTDHVPTGEEPAEVGVWDMGLDEYAEPVSVGLDGVPGATVAGLPGYGKTSLINKLICDMAPSPAVQIAVADGKVSQAHEGDYADVIGRLFAFVGDDLADANALFKKLVQLRKDRSASIRGVLGATNMWSMGPSEGWPLVVLVIDEAHTYFRDYKGSDAATKKLAALAAENQRLVEDLVKKGRSVGMLVILATQKSTGDAIPTFIRDVCPVGLSFAQKTAEAAVAALGDDIRNWPDANPTTLQSPVYRGVASMAIQGRPGYTRIRTPFVQPEDAAWVSEATAHLTQDPAELLAALVGPADLEKEEVEPADDTSTATAAA